MHVEIVQSMDTNFCVIGDERLIVPWGTTSMIWSNNVTNFLAAEKEFRECIEKWNVINIAAELAHSVIKWKHQSAQ